MISNQCRLIVWYKTELLNIKLPFLKAFVSIIGPIHLIILQHGKVSFQALRRTISRPRTFLVHFLNVVISSRIIYV